MSYGDWPPLEQSWPEESTVRVLNADESDRLARTLPPADDIEKEWIPPHEETRRMILDNAAEQIDVALEALRSAVDWFSVVDPTDRSEVVRAVDDLANTIHYKRTL